MFGRSASRPSPRQSGQTLVEFAMVIPMVLVLLMALLELGLALNASLAVNRASQHGAHVAATAGSLQGADCLILEAIDGDLGVPNSPAKISEVRIERTSLVGDFVDLRQRWLRGGSTDCARPDGNVVALPYYVVEETYPWSERCTVLKGCPSFTPIRTTVDNVGVTIVYTHDWVTPLNGALTLLVPGSSGGGGSGSGGWTFEQRNIFRIEPTL